MVICGTTAEPEQTCAETHLRLGRSLPDDLPQGTEHNDNLSEIFFCINNCESLSDLTIKQFTELLAAGTRRTEEFLDHLYFLNCVERILKHKSWWWWWCQHAHPSPPPFPPGPRVSQRNERTRKENYKWVNRET